MSKNQQPLRQQSNPSADATETQFSDLTSVSKEHKHQGGSYISVTERNQNPSDYRNKNVNTLRGN